LPSPAVIVLEDGRVFSGEALAGSGSVGGELVFNTSMSGYQEIATDPSYCGQIVTYTFPMNGNYGADAGRDESGKAHSRAIIARELTNYRYNRDSRQTWLDWLAEHGVLAVTGVDTRALTRHIREKGALRAVVSTDVRGVKELRKAAQGLPVMGGLDLARVVTCEKAYEAPAPEAAPAPDLHVVAYDYGVKRSMLGYLAHCGFRVTVVPAQTSAAKVLKLQPDGVFLSNGPGDPAAVTYGVKAVERLLGKVPVFGICLGHQLLAQALGMKTFKLKFGHRGANHPVKDLRTGVIEITTQNHGFAVKDEQVPGAEITHVNLNDGTVEGVASPDKHAFSVQYHPESTPGPHDSLYLFQRFRDEIGRFKRGGDA
jgi:carbamoyl-phosphate synthase small subunit